MEIIFLLGKGKPMNVSVITTQFRVSRPAISHHLKVLKDAGIVAAKKLDRRFFITPIGRGL